MTRINLDTAHWEDDVLTPTQHAISRIMRDTPSPLSERTNVVLRNGKLLTLVKR